MWGVVINPISGQGVGEPYGARVTTFLAQRKIPFQAITGSSAQQTSQGLAHFLLENDDCEGVFAVGGDGLAHLVLQQLANTRVPLAIIPAGTGNDLCRSLGWPLDNLDVILESIISEAPEFIDLGLVNNEWFGAILSTGFDSVVNERANKMGWPKGPAKYNVAIARELPGFKPRHYKITLDDYQFETEAMLIAVGNGRSYGGGMQVCPQAKMQDGLFDVMVLRPISKLQFLRVFPKVYAGTHVDHPAVDMYRSKQIIIEAQAIAYADGERLGPLPISAQCIPSAVSTWMR
ncbi:MAG TPA: YegS/Rv2252/BmrU family lipid kinase [Candidatus Nanopelagicaceae bacterium]